MKFEDMSKEQENALVDLVGVSLSENSKVLFGEDPIEKQKDINKTLERALISNEVNPEDYSERMIAEGYRKTPVRSAMNIDPEQGFVGKTFDLLLRPMYAITGGIENIFDEDTATNVIQGAAEGFVGEDKIGGTELVAEIINKDVDEMGGFGKIAGLITEIALDPITYISLGIVPAIKYGGKAVGKVLGKTGAKTAKVATKGEKAGTSLVDKLGRTFKTNYGESTVNRNSMNKLDAIVANEVEGFRDEIIGVTSDYMDSGLVDKTNPEIGMKNLSMALETNPDGYSFINKETLEETLKRDKNATIVTNSSLEEIKKQFTGKDGKLFDGYTVKPTLEEGKLANNLNGIKITIEEGAEKLPDNFKVKYKSGWRDGKVIDLSKERPFADRYKTAWNSLIENITKNTGYDLKKIMGGEIDNYMPHIIEDVERATSKYKRNRVKNLSDIELGSRSKFGTAVDKNIYEGTEIYRRRSLLKKKLKTKDDLEFELDLLDQRQKKVMDLDATERNLKKTKDEISNIDKMNITDEKNIEYYNALKRDLNITKEKLENDVRIIKESVSKEIPLTSGERKNLDLKTKELKKLNKDINELKSKVSLMEETNIDKIKGDISENPFLAFGFKASMLGKQIQGAHALTEIFENAAKHNKFVDKKKKPTAGKEIIPVDQFLSQINVEGGFYSKFFKNLQKKYPDINLSSDMLTHKGIEVKDEVAELLSKSFNPTSVGEFIKLYDNMMRYVKGGMLASIGYHMRNFFGNTVNTYLGGLNPLSFARYTDKAGKLTSEYKKLKKLNLKGIKLNPEQLKTIETVDEFIKTGLGSMGRYASEGGELISELSKITGRDANVVEKALQANLNFGKKIEFNQRMGAFLWAKKNPNKVSKWATKGAKTPNEIAEQFVRTTLFDYRDLTNIEKDIFGRMLPFYTFTRKNLALQAQAILNDPGRLSNMYKGYEYLWDRSGLEEGDIPTYYKEQFYIPLKLFSQGEDVRAIKASNPTFEAINQIFTPMQSFTDLLTPMLKIPIETAMGVSMFSGQPIIDPTDERNNAIEYLDYIARSSGAASLVNTAETVATIWDNLFADDPASITLLPSVFQTTEKAKSQKGHTWEEYKKLQNLSSTTGITSSDTLYNIWDRYAKTPEDIFDFIRPDKSKIIDSLIEEAFK